MEVVVSILADSFAELEERALAAAEHADAVELRLDRLASASEPDLARLVARLEKPVIAAVNGPEAFGTFRGDDARRFDLLLRAARAGVTYVDVDVTRAGALPSLPSGVARIVSRHVAAGESRGLDELLAEQRAVARRGDRIKLVPHAEHAEDALAILDLVEREAARGAPIVGFASGIAGAFTRVVAPLCGSLATYAAAPDGRATAPGQLTAEDVRAAWPSSAGSRTRIVAVLGRPVGHSLSPRVHSAGLRALSLDLSYVACEPRDLATFVARAASRWRGFAVTMPFKEDAARLATERDADVEATGAANTLVRTANGWRAHNTDVVAVRGAVLDASRARGRSLAGSRAVVVGTGGAARAALVALRGADLAVAGRDPERTRRLADELGARPLALADLARERCDVIVHATPAGSFAQPGVLAIPDGAIARGAVVLDAVYRPGDPPLALAARRAGALYVPGREWFLRQALAQFELVTGVAAPESVLAAALDAALSDDARIAGAPRSRAVDPSDDDAGANEPTDRDPSDDDASGARA